MRWRFVFKHKAKIEWLKLGDANNSYFHASLKSKNHAKCMHMLQKEDGTTITTQAKIEEVVLDYYVGLMGKKNTNLIHIGVESMRYGSQRNMDQRESLIGLVSE